MQKDLNSWLERVISKGLKDALAELEKDDTVDQEREFNNLEERLKRRKKNSPSHKRLEELRKITRNK